MPCDRTLKPQQTIQGRAQEIREAISRLSLGLVAGRVKAIIGPQGAIAFQGWTDEDRDSVTDSCAYRRIMATGSALAKAQIARAEQMSGRTVNREALAHGHHSHDGGETWHHGH